MAATPWSHDTILAPTAVAEDVVPRSSITDLQSTLEKVLRARRPEEFEFIDNVVDMVEQGHLPRSVVESTFQWARKKPRRPFQYFERAMRIRAKEFGVEL
jgi:hypothetical protein